MKYKAPISVIMPVYNCSNFVSAAIESILTQSFTDFEFIIINDGSTDATDEVINSFADHRIRYIKLTKRVGNYTARNIGLKSSYGKYVAIMDADDISVQDRLLIQFNYMERYKKVGCIGGMGKIIGNDGIVIGVLERVKGMGHQQIKVELLCDNCMLHPTLMIRRHLLVKHQIEYDESLYFSSDYDFLVKCSDLFIIRNLPQILLYYRIHPKQISSSDRLSQQNYADIVRIRQLDRLKLSLDTEDLQIYLMIMKNERVSINHLDRSIDILNLVIEHNAEYRVYSIKQLHFFFDIILTRKWIQCQQRMY